MEDEIKTTKFILDENRNSHTTIFITYYFLDTQEVSYKMLFQIEY